MRPFELTVQNVAAADTVTIALRQVSSHSLSRRPVQSVERDQLGIGAAHPPAAHPHDVGHFYGQWRLVSSAGAVMPQR